MTNRGPTTSALTGSKGTSGPRTATRGSRNPTASQVMRAKSQAVGGRRKRCLKGKNCSAACIQSEMVCLVEFPLPISQAISKTRTALGEYISKKHNLEPGSIQERRIDAALSKMSEVLETKSSPGSEDPDRLKKPNVEWKRDERRSLRRGLPWQEVQDLRERQKLLSDAEILEEGMKALQKDAFSRGLTLPWNEVKMIYEALPESTQKALSRTGKASGKWWAGVDDEGNDVFTKSPSKNRGIAVLDTWLRQGGTSAYDSRGGRTWAPQDLDIEHVQTFGKGKKDSPSNWVLARSGAQRARGAKGLRSWIDSLPKDEKEYKTYLSNLRSEASKRKAKKAVLKALDPSQYSDKEIFGWGAAKSGKVFGARTLFTGEFQPIQNIRQGAGRPNSGPPMPFSKAVAVIAKNQGVKEAETVVYELRDIWNKQLISNKSLSPGEAYGKMVEVVQRKLTPEQNQIFQPAAEAWARSRDVQPYGFLQ